MPDPSRQVHLCYSPETAAACDTLPSNPGRLSLIDSLIEAYGLHRMSRLIRVAPASQKDICMFHDEGFVSELLRSRDGNDESTDVSKALPKYGLAYDCPPFAGLDKHVQLVAGSSISASHILLSKKNDSKCQHVAINWYGGRHHALKAAASGFCYVNDIVLAILSLRRVYRKVFYLDVDLHHGDGVETAFEFLKYVHTFSIHRHDIGLFPGTGGSSKPGAYNFPTKRGLSDGKLARVITDVVVPLISDFQPDCIVLQCGSDGLASDPNGEWNLSINGLTDALMRVVNGFPKTPFLVLGGGGYNHRETARFCAWFTKCLLGDDSEWCDIPEHVHLDSYEKDSFQFWTLENVAGKPARRDENVDIQGAITEFWRVINMGRE